MFVAKTPQATKYTDYFVTKNEREQSLNKFIQQQSGQIKKSNVLLSVSYLLLNRIISSYMIGSVIGQIKCVDSKM